MSYIKNFDELVDNLRPRLQDYLVGKIGASANRKSFCCYLHEDNTPSMSWVPRSHKMLVHCFSCGATHDIFAAAAHFESLPAQGAEWATITVPTLAEHFGLSVHLADSTPGDKERTKLLKLTHDVANFLSVNCTTTVEDYMKNRGWDTEHITIGQVSQKQLIEYLVGLGWDESYISEPLLLNRSISVFGEDYLTLVVRDYRKRAIGFIARNIAGGEPKYVNSPESLIYEKRKSLVGIDVALADVRKRAGLYIVEGPGDLLALHRVGITNAVAVSGTALTTDHLALLKMLGVTHINLCLDWDEAGQKSTLRILNQEMKSLVGISCSIIMQPKNSTAKDISELLQNENDADLFLEAESVSAFEYLIESYIDMPPEELCIQLVPIIASESTAIRRESLIKTLSQKTNITQEVIREDVHALRDGKSRERNNRVTAAAEKYVRDIAADPENADALLVSHQADITYIDKEFKRSSIGVDYQLTRYDSLQTLRLSTDYKDHSDFRLNRFTLLAQALEGNMPWTEGTLIYVGGRANAGKTAVCIAIAVDIALSDPDAKVIMHFTDDSYTLVEPRIKANIAMHTSSDSDATLTIGMTANPIRNIRTNSEWIAYHKADAKLRELIENEKLVIIDSEDGANLSTLEKYIRTIRSKYPDSKIFVMCDNTHNYHDFFNLESTQRMTQIANTQKELTIKYRCCMMATAEYRKNAPIDTTKIRFPVDDDLADARALMYRPNLIIHVYNDKHDRKDSATICWSPGYNLDIKHPRLLLILSKNKISSFKDKLTLDLDPDTTTLKQVDINRARAESSRIENEYEDSDYEMEGVLE